MPMPFDALRRTFAALLLSTLAACGGGGGGGGGGNGGTDGSGSGASLSVVVTADGGAVLAEDGTYRVDESGRVTLACSRACTFSQRGNDGVTVSAESTSGTEWSAHLAFASGASRLTVQAQAADGASAAVTLAPRITATAVATWSLDDHHWTRDDSTQQRLEAISGNETVITTGLAMTSNGMTRPCVSTTPFACSTVSIHFSGTSPGRFTFDPDFMTRIGPQLPSTYFLRVKVTSPTPEGPYLNDDYVPEQGTLVVTQDAQGTFHYSTEGALTVHHEAPLVPGVPGAPATMQFRLTDGF